ncbi:uncharacterized protein [Montipora foliosa]|uniref:uncharacterized protein n=1 Tax=Montipora foliosa TaxID=591990 RepID=UPI0035F15CC0
MNVWIESISRTHFMVCLRESRTFDGPHSNLIVNWMAYEHYPTVWKVKESSKILFSNYEIPLAQNNYALCKVINFTGPFYEPPIVLTTAVKDIKNNSNPLCAVKGPLNSWVEEINRAYVRVCIKDYAGIDGQRDNLEVHYVVIGDYDPCKNSSCKYESKPVALSSQRCDCVCESSCPSYQEEMCASNGRTFRNLCLLQKEICETKGNYTHYHPGSCAGFPLQKGRHQFTNHPSWAEDQCETIQFKPFVFYPHQKIFIQLTINHVNYSDPTYVHEATTPWIESVNSTQFTACVTRTGRNDYPSDSFATVDWVAYQGAPPGGIAGEKKFSRWWTGTSCQTVTLPSGKFSSQPTVFVTAEHYRSSLKHDAGSVWLEDVSARSFKICIRELQNFAGVHDDISVNWLAFETIHRPLFSEHNNVSFPNGILPSKSNNFAFCQDVNFTRTYNNYPTVIVTAKHSSGGGNTSPDCNGIVSWIEFISNARFRICVKDLFVQRFDPLTVSYAVLADICPDNWIYFKGYCYQKVSSCDSWSNSQSRCAALGANLPSVHSQEENVFLQNLHNGENGWLGLSDINREGTFVWSDGTRFDFHYWATNQPNNFRNEDCVHTLGTLPAHRFKWNDVNCSSCHEYSCKKDYDECQGFSHDCPEYATCNNTEGSFNCSRLKPCDSSPCINGGNCTNEAAGNFTCHWTGETCQEMIAKGIEKSVMIGSNATYLVQLRKWLKPVSQGNSFWKLCWCASRDGWASSTFHILCDGKGATVTIIKVNQYIFGGYASISWGSSCSYRYDATAFLFSLRNKPGWAPTKLPQTGLYSSRRTYSIYDCNGHGPTFGGGHDIYISNLASSGTSSYSNLGHDYGPPAGHAYRSTFARTFLAGTYHFRPTEVEVFYLTS